jgi:hypothetical protein
VLSAVNTPLQIPIKDQNFAILDKSLAINPVSKGITDNRGTSLSALLYNKSRSERLKKAGVLLEKWGFYPILF